jgi:hypothetical protein
MSDALDDATIRRLILELWSAGARHEDRRRRHAGEPTTSLKTAEDALREMGRRIVSVDLDPANVDVWRDAATYVQSQVKPDDPDGPLRVTDVDLVRAAEAYRDAAGL